MTTWSQHKWNRFEPWDVCGTQTSQIVVGISLFLHLYLTKRWKPTTAVTELYTLRWPYRCVHRRNRSGRDVLPGRILCPEHHAALGSQCDDDWPAASSEQLLCSPMRLLNVGYRGGREQLSLPGDTHFSTNTHTRTHAQHSPFSSYWRATNTLFFGSGAFSHFLGGGGG